MERAQSTLQPGYMLDRYELLCPIASGGMAVVWLARLRGKRGFEKLFAVKTIKTELIHDVRFQEMFLDEARIASGIQHPNVAQILDLGEQDDVLYIVMEWVEGESLARIRKLAPKRGTALPLGVTLRVIADACAGLHAAHQLRDVRGKIVGLVHRDVSPQNILLSAAGSVRVIDFGIAKATNRSAGDTQSGVIKGKIHYMAPEQAGGRAIDRRVDIWAMGVCLYELVVGRLPFDGDSDVDVVRRLLGDEPAPRPDASVPAPVAEIIGCSLARDPGTRFLTAAAMQRAIETVIDQLGLQATNEDVAEFLQTHFSDLAEQRAAMVTNAIEAAEARETSGAQTKVAPGAARADEDVGFAPTVLSSAKPERSASPSAGKAAPASRGSAGVARPSPPPPKEESKLTLGSAALEMEGPAGLPKRRVWVWALLFIIGGGGWYGLRMRGVERIQSLLAPISAPASPQMTSAAPAPTTTWASAPSSATVNAVPPMAPAMAASPPGSASSGTSPPATPPPASTATARTGSAAAARPSTPSPTTPPAASPPEAPPAPIPAKDDDNPYN